MEDKEEEKSGETVQVPPNGGVAETDEVHETFEGRAGGSNLLQFSSTC